jgi:hypothetical protein
VAVQIPALPGVVQQPVPITKLNFTSDAEHKERLEAGDRRLEETRLQKLAVTITWTREATGVKPSILRQSP